MTASGPYETAHKAADAGVELGGYDDRGQWIRKDRPEMLSDRLGYPSERGDEDWLRIKAAREGTEGVVGARPSSSDGGDDRG